MGRANPISSHLDTGTAWIAACDDIGPFLTTGQCPSGQFAVGAPGWTETVVDLTFVAADSLGQHESITYDQVLIVDAASVPESVRNGGGTIAEILAQTDGDPASVERVRTAVEASHPDWTVSTPAEQRGQQFSQITEVGWIVVLGTIGTLLMAGCSLAVAVAGGLVERRRPLALLRLTGMPVRRLQSIVMLEAAPPLLIAAFVSAVLGVAVADSIVAMLANAEPARAGPGIGPAAGIGRRGRAGDRCLDVPVARPGHVDGGDPLRITDARALSRLWRAPRACRRAVRSRGCSLTPHELRDGVRVLGGVEPDLGDEAVDLP